MWFAGYETFAVQPSSEKSVKCDFNYLFILMWDKF